jgi:GTP diphosphokinase / guanosine-3',5'-bis(diphosphate) 3'-diphosphatase
MVRGEKTFDEIFDIRAVRIITDEVKNCYAILGVVHSMWPPIPSRFKDYIAVPKSNMYQSLHTTVTGPDNHFLEIQIRTREMEITAEMGIAAHWAYKEHVSPGKRDLNFMSLLEDIKKWRDEIRNTREFMTELKMDLYKEEIFVFTPKGKIIKLAMDSTPIDFAYSIHSEVGHHTSGARVNSKLVPLRTKLQNGDIVEIITAPNKGPSEAWLKLVRSSGARSKIKNWLNHHRLKTAEKTAESGNDETKPAKKTRVSVPDRDLIKIKQVNIKNKSTIMVDGNSNVLITISQCCQPIPGDDVIGFITRGRGITVHKTTCPSIKRLKPEKERFIKIVWAASSGVHPVKIAIEAVDRPHLLKDIADKIFEMDINIHKMEAQSSRDGIAELKLVINVESVDQLNIIMLKLKTVKDIVKVYKVNEKVVLK